MNDDAVIYKTFLVPYKDINYAIRTAQGEYYYTDAYFGYPNYGWRTTTSIGFGGAANHGGSFEFSWMTAGYINLETFTSLNSGT